MPTVAEFKAALATEDEDTIIDRFLMASDSEHITTEQKAAIRDALAAAYGTPREDVTIVPTGSGHLGFALMPKTVGNEVLPAYRPFSARSDIDIAVVSPTIWSLVAKEVSDYSHKRRPFPWRAHKYGDYLVCGWVRPDHFPRARLTQCDLWWKVFKTLSRDTTYGRRDIRGGLFYSEQYLKDYMRRSVSVAKRREVLG